MMEDEVKLTSHQKAWLRGHPHRTAEWLKERLADGFDIHHADANPKNNQPNNLVLIESMDHGILHGAPRAALLRAAARSVEHRQALRQESEAKRSVPLRQPDELLNPLQAGLLRVGL